MKTKYVNRNNLYIVICRYILQKFRLHELWLQKPCGPEFKEVWGKFQNLFRVRIGNAIVYCKKNFDMNIPITKCQFKPSNICLISNENKICK
jgi:hypothetical protein